MEEKHEHEPWIQSAMDEITFDMLDKMHEREHMDE